MLLNPLVVRFLLILALTKTPHFRAFWNHYTSDSKRCDQKGYIKKDGVSRENGVAYIRAEVEANGVIHRSTCSG